MSSGPIIPPTASSEVQISYVVREYVRMMLKDPNFGFNGMLLLSSSVYKVCPFTLCDCPPNLNLFLGRYRHADIATAYAGRDYFPYAVLSVANSDMLAKNGMKVTPSTFSGVIPISLDFVISVQDGSVPLDGEANYHAVEDAMYNTFNTPTSFGLMPPGVGYNNELKVEQGVMEYDTSRWLQLIACTMMFYKVG